MRFWENLDKQVLNKTRSGNAADKYDRVKGTKEALLILHPYFKNISPYIGSFFRNFPG